MKQTLILHPLYHSRRRNPPPSPGGKGDEIEKLGRNDLATHRNEQIWHPPLILVPSLAILGPAALDVPGRTVGDHAREEEWVEPWEGGSGAGDKTPGKCEEEVAGVVDLAGVAIWRK
jgi:hypothetical protein